MQYKIVQKKIVVVLIISIIGFSVLGFVLVGHMNHSSNNKTCLFTSLIGEKCSLGSNVFTFLKQHISSLQYFIVYIIELKLMLLFAALFFSFFVIILSYIFQSRGVLKIMYYFKRIKLRPIENIFQDIFLLKYISLNKKADTHFFSKWVYDNA